MVLKINFDQFAEEIAARLDTQRVYITARGDKALVSAGSPDLLIISESNQNVAKTTQVLEAQGLSVRRGQWAQSIDDLVTSTDEMHVFAVAYRSEVGTPGLWVDAGLEPLSSAEVLQSLYDELIENGEISNFTYEEFVQAANANILILAPDQLRRFAETRVARSLPTAEPEVSALQSLVQKQKDAPSD